MLGSKYDICISSLREIENQTKIYNEKVDRILSMPRDTRSMDDTAQRNTTDLDPSYTHTIFQEWNEINLEKEAFKKRNQMKKVWYRNLNERKQAFFNAARTEDLANTYDTWKNKEQPILPKKIRIKQIPSEPEEEFTIRYSLALQKFESEITILRLRVPKLTAKFQNADTKMRDEISKRSNGKVREKLLQLWELDTAREEEKSKRILETKNQWLQNYEQNYGKEPEKVKKVKTHPKQGGFQNRRPQTILRPRSRSRSQRRTYAEAVKRGPQRQRQNTGPGPLPMNRRRGPQNRRQNQDFTDQPERQVQMITQQPQIQQTTNKRNFVSRSRADPFLGRGLIWKKRRKRNQKS